MSNKAMKDRPPKQRVKLTRAEKKQIAALIQQANGDGKNHTAQQTIPYETMFPDGICRVRGKLYSKSIEFFDVNYQLAQPDDKTATFEALCDFYNSLDSSIGLQLTFVNRIAGKEDYERSIAIPPQQDGFDDVRAEYAAMLKSQLSKGNNGLVKKKYLTFTLEADNMKTAKSRLARLETDIQNHLKILGTQNRPLDGKDRLEVLYGIFHPEGGQSLFL